VKLLFVPMLIVCCLMLASCQAVYTATSVVTGSIGCGINQDDIQPFKQGDKVNINVGFDMVEGNKVIRISEQATCDYQGAMCAGAAWHSIWYGDQSKEVRKYKFQSGHVLNFSEHGLCIDLNEYFVNCSSKDCDANSQFDVALDLPDHAVDFFEAHDDKSDKSIEAQVRRTYSDRKVLAFSEFHMVNLNVKNIAVSVSEVENENTTSQ